MHRMRSPIESRPLLRSHPARRDLFAVQQPVRFCSVHYFRRFAIQGVILTRVTARTGL